MAPLTPPPKKKGGHPPAHGLRLLLTSLAPLGKSDQVPAALGQQIFEAALLGRPYPFSVLQRALLRERAEIGRDAWADLQRRDARRSLIKAVLERRRRTGQNHPYPELRPTMDPNNHATGYVLGRLMAVIERLQQEALGDVNASVVDRFFGAASATPLPVFVRLMKNARHHARKALDGKRRRFAKRLERLLDELSDRFDPKEGGFPTHLDLEQQGLFILGYHQQRKAFFTKKTDAEAPDEPAAEGPDTA